MKRSGTRYIIPVMIILLVIVVYTKNLGKVEIDISQTEGTSIVESFEMGSTLAQKFVSNKNRLCGIAIQFGTYSRENEGNIRLEIVNEEGKKVVTTNVNKKNLEDNAYYEWFFPPIVNSKDKEYSLNIYDESKSIGNEVTLYKNIKEKYWQYGIIKDARTEEGNLNMITYYVE